MNHDHVSIEDLIPYARNARTHSDEQVNQIAASIREFGFTVPVIMDETKRIIAGHGRVLAAKKVGLTDVPVVVVSGWSEAKKQAYTIADNKLTLNGGWDEELLKLELQDIADSGIDLSVVGFSESEIDFLLREANFEEQTEDEQARLDETSPTVCPNCGHEF